MQQKNTFSHMRRGWAPGFACLILMTSIGLQAQTAATNIAVGTTVLQPTVKHLGINLGTHNYWDSGQMMQNLVLENPGFEGEIYQSIIECGSGTTTTCVDSDTSSSWTSGFWNGATFEFFYGAANGSTGTVSSYTKSGSSGVLTFSSALPVAPANGDFVIVRQTVPGNATAGWWTSTGGNGSITTNTTDLPSGTGGTQTVAMTAPTASDSATLDSYFDSTSGKSFIQLNGSYEVTFLAKATAGSDSVLVSVTRAGTPAYLSKTVALTNSWASYTLTFSAAETGSSVGTVGLQFQTVGQDSFYLDDVSLQPTSPAQPTAFRDAVVSTLTSLSPGVLRWWSGNSLGDTLDNMIAGPFARQRSGYSAFGTSMINIEWGLYDFLQLCQTVGAEPWVVVPSTFSTTDAANLIEYLASESSTTYGAKRAAQGQTAPWTSVLSKIHLEFGNEEWNSTFRGGSIEVPAAYGARAQTIFGAMRADPAYVASSFDLVLGGQAGNPWLNQQTQNATNNNDSFGLAPYLMYTVNTFDNNTDLFGPLLAEPQAFLSPSGNAEGVSSQYLTVNGKAGTVEGGMLYLDELAIQNSSHPVPLAIYEANLSTDAGSITQSVINDFTPSIGAGIATIENMLLGMSQGMINQNLYALPQWHFSISTSGGATTVPLWGAVVDMGGPTNLKRPQYLAIQAVNQTIPTGAAMLQTVQSGANPTWNQALVNSVQLNGVQEIESFAFSNGTQSGLVLLNVSTSSTLPVTFSGANAPTGDVQVTVLTSANLTDTNETSSVVAPVTSSETFTSGTSLSLPPFSLTALTWNGSGVQSTGPTISNVQATAITATGATITWTTSTPTSSEVKYGPTASYGSTTPVVSTLLTSHSVTLTGLTGGTLYDFAVVSVDGSSNSVTSPNATFTTLAAAPVISNVQATAITATGATITWTTSTPTSSQVSYGQTTSYGTSTPVVSTLVTSHSVTLTGLTAGITYDFEVVSVDASSNSVTSSNSSFSTLASTMTISAVQATAITATGATITWTTSAPASSQVVYGLTSSYGSSTTAVATLVTSHSVTLTGLTAGTAYNFAAVSAPSGGTSTTSANSTFTTTAAAPVISNIQATAITSSGATITWTTTTPSSSQVLYGTTSSYGSSSPVASALVTSHSVTLTGLTGGTTYDYAVVSVDANSQSVTSISYSFATLAGSSVISSVQATSITATGATITWTTSVAASSQVVYGLTTAYGSSTTAVSTLVTSHSVTLTGLTAGTAYDFAVVSAPSGGTSVTSANSTFTTLAGAPVISNVQATGITATGATITWTTSTPTSSEVVYGATTAYGSSSPVVSALVTSHSVTLSGLTASTPYDFAVVSVDASSNSVTSTNYSFSTLATSTGTPVMSSVQATGITASGATITWTTNMASSSQVVYGLTTAYGSSTAVNSAMVMSHSMTLSGLSAGTAYNFAVVSAPSGGAAVTSSNYSFTTTPALSTGTSAPVISGVQATNITGTGATITWTTNVPSGSEVVYGTSSPWGGLSLYSGAPVLSHSLTLTGLTPSTKYVFAVESAGSSGPWGVSSISSFTTAGGTTTPASGPPVISNVQSSDITASGATITWTTNVPAGSEVVYGTTTPWGGLTVYAATPVTSHSMNLTGLAAGTKYVFAVESAGSTGPWTVSSIYSFTTSSALTISLPVGSSGSPVISNVQATPISASSVVVTWTTSTPGTSLVVYGTVTPWKGPQGPYSASLVTSHSVTLTGLTPGTSYVYAVESDGSSGPWTVSSIFSFTMPNATPTLAIDPLPI
jgi:hypothetical protein